MKKNLFVFLMAYLFGIHGSFADAVTEKYMLVISDGNVTSETNASTWFTGKYGDKGVVKTVSEFVSSFNNSTIDPAEYQVIWVHLDQGKDAAPNMSAFADVKDELQTYSKAGGSLLLTLHASYLLGTTNGIGRITDTYRANLTTYHPDGNVQGINRNGYCHVGTDDDIFSGLTDNGTGNQYNLIEATSKELHEVLWDFNAFSLPDTKLMSYESTTSSKVLGTWTHVGDAAVGGIIEYKQTWNGSTGFKGTSIAIGLGCYAWDAGNKTACGTTTNIAKLTENSIAYLDAQNINKAPVDPDTYCQTKYVLVLKSAYTHGGENTGLTADEVAAADWFWANYSNVRDEITGYYKGQIIPASELGSIVNITPAITKVVWAHLDNARFDNEADAQAYAGTALGATAINALKDYVLAGGNLYASKYATELVASIGRIPTAYQPNLLNEVNNNDKKGISPAIGWRTGLQLFDHQYHPIYNGLASTDRDGHISYNFLSTATTAGTGLMWGFNSITGIDNAAEPYQLVDFEIMTNSIVLGAWEHVVDYHDGGIIEFLPIANPTGSNDEFKGRIIANGLGGYDWNNNEKAPSTLTSNDNLDSNIELLTKNAIEYLATQKLRKVAYLLPENLDPSNSSKDEPLEVVDQDDERTALEWFISDLVNTNQGAILQPKDLADLDPTEYTTMWIHIDRDGTAAEFNNWGGLNNPNNVTMLVRYAKNGGNLLLTKHAIQLVVDNYQWRNSTSEGYTQTTISSMERCWDAYPIVVERGEGLKSNNADEWVINPVIGQGRRSDKGGNGYVRYTDDGNGIPILRSEGLPIHDNFANHLYYDMGISSNTYPIGPTGGGDKVFYDVYTILGAQETANNKEDHNCGWLFDVNNDAYQTENDYITAFENNNVCTVLGQWGHKTALDNAMIVQFHKTGNWNDNAWEGEIICFGLGAYEWQPGNELGVADRSLENPFIANIKQLTLNALNVLENDMSGAETTTFEVGDVKYTGWDNGVQHVATILSANPSLQVYDLTKKPAGSHLGEGKVTDSATGLEYEITGIGLGAFIGCTSLAYADLMDFKGVMPEDVRNRFPAWTIIYLPQEQYAASLATCPIKGENIVNTLTNGTKVSEKLKVYDNEVINNDYVYHLFANKYEFTANAVEFNRAFSAVKSTVCLPFAINNPSDFGTFYAFDKIDGSDVRFTSVSSAQAYRPYMFEPKAEGTVISINGAQTISILDNNPAWESDTYTLSTTLPQKWYTDDEANSKDANFIGEFRPQVFTTAKADGIYAYKSDGSFKTGTIYADPFRAYLKLNTPSAGAKFNAVFFDGFTPSGVSQIETTAEAADNGAYYTLQGVKVTTPGPGIYIHNKKKVIVK